MILMKCTRVPDFTWSGCIGLGTVVSLNPKPTLVFRDSPPCFSLYEVSCARELFRAEGINAFVRGLLPQVVGLGGPKLVQVLGFL